MEWHDNRCQMCDLRIEVPGGSYSEGAHVRALGAPPNGLDTTGNVLCLCPNCHVMLDAGAIVIEDDLTVIRGGQPTGTLRTDPRHLIDLECVRHHRELLAPIDGLRMGGFCRAVCGPSADDLRRLAAADNDHGVPDTTWCRARRSPNYTHVSSHIRSRHKSSGIDVPVYSGQK
ncbi:HNH endonuclease [Streptomyces sp. CS090A]|uniref:HNH endonuclease n=1 Tax=Streptomyces sp. CS090A TaxID=2162710 RepID=UPI0023B7DE8F|nr:HNH endonuclease [Streptomyces sp. CS090A]